MQTQPMKNTTPTPAAGRKITVVLPTAAARAPRRPIRVTRANPVSHSRAAVPAELKHLGAGRFGERPRTVELPKLQPASSEANPETAGLIKLGKQAARLAHDLNNCLSPAMMLVGILGAELTDPRHLKLIEIARTGMKRAADMNNEVLASAHGHLQNRSSTTAPREVMEELYQASVQLVPASVSVQMEAPANLPCLNVCPTRLSRALANLCVNARDAMPDGGILRLFASKVEYEFSQGGATKTRHFVLFEISDTGSGIPDAIRSKIFEPFFTTKAKGKGTGLGLDSVREFVAEHGGKLSVQTQTGVGTSFRILLPARPGFAA